MRGTVFFSWQTDRKPKEGRNFIERALEVAAARVARDLEVSEADRDEDQAGPATAQLALVVDKDTKGVPGSPPIFETILRKIDAALVFVADLTFTGARSDGRPTPNPNVLIEYGWALKSLGHFSVIGVMNAAHGSPTRATLPFDLASLRFPIVYTLNENASESDRQTERARLTDDLEAALRAVMASPELQARLPKPPQKSASAAFIRKEPMYGKARFRPQGLPLGLTRNLVTNKEENVFLVEGPATWLRLMPLQNPGRTWLNQDLKEKAKYLSTIALLQVPGGDIGYVRSDDGCGYYRGIDVSATGVAYVFNSGELWVINAFRPHSGRHIAYEEPAFIETLDYCASFLEGIGCARPFRWAVGIEGLKDLYLVSNRSHRSIGPSVASLVEEEGDYVSSDKAANLLVPFFERVHDVCDSRRS